MLPYICAVSSVSNGVALVREPMYRVIQLVNRETARLAQISRMSNVLRDIVLRASKIQAAGLLHATVVPNLVRSNPVFDGRVVVPSILVLVQVARDGRDVEHVEVVLAGAAPDGEGGTAGWFGVDGELEVAPGGSVVWDVEEELGPDL